MRCTSCNQSFTEPHLFNGKCGQCWADIAAEFEKREPLKIAERNFYMNLLDRLLTAVLTRDDLERISEQDAVEYVIRYVRQLEATEVILRRQLRSAEQTMKEAKEAL